MGSRSHFVRGAPVRISLDDPITPESEWIEIISGLTFGQRNILLDELISAGGMEATGAMVTARYGHYLTSILEAAITGWQLKDEQGQRVAFDKKLIAAFDPEDLLIDKVLVEVATRYPLAKLSGGLH
jgi:hypothetical protein